MTTLIVLVVALLLGGLMTRWGERLADWVIPVRLNFRIGKALSRFSLWLASTSPTYNEAVDVLALITRAEEELGGKLDTVRPGRNYPSPIGSVLPVLTRCALSSILHRRKRETLLPQHPPMPADEWERMVYLVRAWGHEDCFELSQLHDGTLYLEVDGWASLDMLAVIVTNACHRVTRGRHRIVVARRERLTNGRRGRRLVRAGAFEEVMVGDRRYTVTTWVTRRDGTSIRASRFPTPSSDLLDPMLRSLARKHCTTNLPD